MPAVIVSTARSPIARALRGGFVGLRPDDLAASIVEAALAKVPQLPREELEDLYLGCGEPYDEQGANIARRVAVQIGLDSLPGATVTRFCASSLQAIRMAYHAIEAGEGDAFVAAGVECVSRYAEVAAAGRGPEICINPRFDAARARSAEAAAASRPWSDPRLDGELPDVYISMGETAENVASLRSVSRERQDAFALRSQQRASAAAEAGFFEREIVAVRCPDGSVVSIDESPRPNTTSEALSELAPVFRADGTVTAGNCCPLNDGAAAVIVMSERRAGELEIEPLARIVSTGVSALSPEIMGLGPVAASQRALKRAGMTIDDVDLVELNEAFAAQVIPCCDDLGIDEQVNVHGGAIALGHPFGMTGARMAATLINGLQTRDAEVGLETMCVGGGQGMAMVLERLS